MQFPDNNKKNLKGLQVKSFERRLFQLLHPEVIVGFFHSLKRANNTRNLTKTALNNCIKIVNDVMSQVLSHKNYKGHFL